MSDDPGVQRVATLVGSARRGVVACMVVQVLQLVGVIERFSFERQDGRHFDSAMGFGHASNALTAAWWLLVAATGGLVIATFRAAYCNRTAFGLPLPDSPRWFVGSWFVPIANLFVPYRNVKRCWEGVVPGGAPDVLWWWWLTFIASGIGVRVFDPPDAAGAALLQAPFRTWTAAMSLLVGGLTLVVLTRLHHDQAEAFATRAQVMGSPAT